MHMYVNRYHFYNKLDTVHYVLLVSVISTYIGTYIICMYNIYIYSYSARLLRQWALVVVVQQVPENYPEQNFSPWFDCVSATSCFQMSSKCLAENLSNSKLLKTQYSQATTCLFFYLCNTNCSIALKKSFKIGLRKVYRIINLKPKQIKEILSNTDILGWIRRSSYVLKYICRQTLLKSLSVECGYY